MRTIVTRIYPADLRLLKNGATAMNRQQHTRRYGLADVLHETIEANHRKNRRISYLEAVIVTLEKKIKELSNKQLQNTPASCR